MFTVPSGGDGLYYFSTYLLVQGGQLGYFNIVVNDVIVCSAYGDENSNSGSDSPQAMCSAVVYVAEGRSRTLLLFQEMKLDQFKGSENSLQLLTGNTISCC